MTTLAVIPARGGSKGIPRKNVRPVAGHPLIAWTIAAANQSKLIDRLVVSTEDDEIGAAARQYGGDVLQRPIELAMDDASTRDVLAHVVDQVMERCDAVVLLQCTSPFRSEGLIDRVITAFELGGWDSMSTGSMAFQFPPHGAEHRRQDLQSVFINDGSVIVTKASNLAAGTLFGEKAGTMVTTREENVDVDDEFDLWVAEKVLERALAEGRLAPPRLVW
jgi:N-acylneuraminate cytidylyltransferase